jgi:2-iminobutanoate/2-iminopropanoate deaminase
MEVLNSIQNAPSPIGPYSQAVKVGSLLFCSGQIAIDPKTGQLISGGIEQQTDQVLRNLAAVLMGAGSSPEKIVMSTIFLTDIDHGSTVNERYKAFVSKMSPPARQTVAVKALPAGAIVEISVIAEAPSSMSSSTSGLNRPY